MEPIIEVADEYLEAIKKQFIEKRKSNDASL